MNTSKLTIQRSTVRIEGYAYPTYKVQGWINGQRVRKQFKSEQEAQGEKHRLEIFAANALDPIRPAVTRLTPAQIADAETAFARLGDRPLSLAVDWFLTTYTAPMAEMALPAAITAFEEDRARHVSALALRDYKATLKRFREMYADKQVHELTTDRIIAFLDAKKVGKKRWNNLRGDLSAFFNFCKQAPRRWTKENPVEPIPAFRIARGLPEILTIEQCESLMRFVETYRGFGDKQPPGCLVPYFALALFAGIRPCVGDGELVRLLAPKHHRLIDLRMGVIRITPEISKTNDLRQIPIRSNLRAWLERYPVSSHPVDFDYFERSVTRVRKACGLTHDVLRHTYISMHVARYKSLAEAALEAGNSEGVVKKHYLNLVSGPDAERFWSISPSVVG